MKKLILILMMLPIVLMAQQSEERYELLKTISLPGKRAGRIWMRAYNYTHREASDFYVVNKEAEPQYQLLNDGRMGYGYINDMLGYQDMSRGKGLVKASGLILYEPADSNRCIKLILIACDIEIRCVRDEADVTITNLRYCHYSRNGNDSTVLPIRTAAQRMAGKGRYEWLAASDICPEEINAVKTFVQQAGNELLERVADGMNGVMGANGKTDEMDW